jgi:putative transposase
MDSREMKLALSVKMSLEGKTSEEISKILCIKQSFIYYWRNIFKTKGIEGIRIGYKGASGYLTDDQTNEVIGWLKAKIYWNMDELID